MINKFDVQDMLHNTFLTNKYLYNSVIILVCYAKIVVRVLTNSARPEGEYTMCQNPDYYFGMAHSNCNTIIIIMLIFYW